MIIITISHVINVLVAGLMALLLIIDERHMEKVFGKNTPARQILSSLYMAIAVASLVALVAPQYSIGIALVLFPIQIFYKLSTLITVSSKKNPVIWWNLVISIVHAVSLYSILILYNS